jgi:hypothetical protein
MLKSKIKTHKSGNKYQNEHFFILNKGNNAGKPLPEYCANCFVFIADNVEEKEFYLYLFYGLWQRGLFRPFITGSAIPFIRLDDLLKVVEETSKKINLAPKNYSDSIQLMNELEKYNEVLLKQIALIKKARTIVL